MVCLDRNRLYGLPESNIAYGLPGKKQMKQMSWRLFTSALVRVGDGRDCQVIGGEVPQAGQHALKKERFRWLIWSFLQC